MKRYLYILSILLLSLSVKVQAQALPSVCTGSKVRYAATPDPLFVNSSFRWVLDERFVSDSEIIDWQGESIDITWSNTPGLAQIGIVEISETGCEGDTVWAYVSIMGAIMAVNDQTACAGDSVTFTDEVGLATTYLWNDTMPGTGSFTVAMSQPGDYKVWVEATNAIGCKTSDTARFTVHPVPVLEILGADGRAIRDTKLCGDTMLTLDGSLSDVFYNWSTGDLSQSISVPAISPDDPDSIRVYKLTVENKFFCSASDSVAIIRCDPSELKEIPMAITPNGDGKNDTWVIPVMNIYTSATVDVYDRWGRLVFSHKRGVYKPWDGKFEGRELPMGNYFYIIQTSKNSKPITGTLLIIR